MAIYTIQAPDGRTFEIEGPANATPAQLQQAAQAAFRMKPAAPQQSYDPTEGMSTFDKFRAGVGKAMVDTARGAGQWVGLVSREDVEAARERDAALMNTTAGSVGNVVGTTAAMLPAALVPGANTLAGAALTGAVAGALQPSTSTSETVANIGLGGALGGGSQVAARALGAGVQGARGLVEPFTQSGREKIAARTLQTFADDPVQAAAAIRARGAELVPGSRPTVGQIANDGGIAQLERALANNADVAGPLNIRYAQQRAARTEALRRIAGDDVTRAAAEKAREDVAGALYQRAFSTPVDESAITPAMEGKIKMLMDSPSMKRAMAKAARIAKDEGIALDNTTSVQGLHYAKMALDDQIGAAVTAGKKTEARALKGLQDRLLSVIDDLSPDYAAARQAYRDASKPINRMEVGTKLLESYDSALSQFGGTTREAANRYAVALKNADATAKKATGFAGAKMSDILTKDQLRTAENVARDLARKTNLEELGRARGSNTAQNLVSQNLMRQILGPTGLPQGWAEAGMLQTLLSPVNIASKAGGLENKVMERLVAALADPNDAMGLLQMAMNPTLEQRIGRGLLPYVAPAGTGLFPVLAE